MFFEEHIKGYLTIFYTKDSQLFVVNLVSKKIKIVNKQMATLNKHILKIFETCQQLIKYLTATHFWAANYSLEFSRLIYLFLSAV